MIAEKKVNVAYQTLDAGGLILIASTTELQAFALGAVEDARAFPEAEFHRRKGATPTGWITQIAGSRFLSSL